MRTCARWLESICTVRTWRVTVGAGPCIEVVPHEKDAAPGAAKTAAFSYKHDKPGSAARKEKQEEAADNRDIHGRATDGRGRK